MEAAAAPSDAAILSHRRLRRRRTSAATIAGPSARTAASSSPSSAAAKVGAVAALLAPMLRSAAAASRTAASASSTCASAPSPPLFVVGAAAAAPIGVVGRRRPTAFAVLPPPFDPTGRRRGSRCVAFARSILGGLSRPSSSSSTPRPSSPRFRRCDGRLLSSAVPPDGDGSDDPREDPPPPPRPRRRLAEFESDFFDVVERPPASSSSAAATDANRPGSSGAAGPVGRPLAASSPRIGGAAVRSRPQPQPQRQREQQRPRASSSPPPRRAMPPPVLEYDYDYFDEDLGVSGAFGDSDDFGGGGGGYADPGRRTARATATAEGAATRAFRGIEGSEDPDYDPYFTVDAEAETVLRLPETERDARWADDDNAASSWDGRAYGLFGDGPIGQEEVGGPTARGREWKLEAARSEEDARPGDASDSAVGGSKFRSAEDFLADKAREDPARATASRSSPDVMAEGAKPVASSRHTVALPGHGSSDKGAPSDPAAYALEERQSSFGAVEDGVEWPDVAVPEEPPHRLARYDEIEDIFEPWPEDPPQGQARYDEIEDIFEATPHSRLGEMEDVVAEASRPADSSPHAPIDSPPPPIIARTASVTSDTTEFLSAAASGNGVTSHLSILSERLDRVKSDIFAANGGRKFNPNSPRQVAEVLYGKDGMEGQSTDRDALEALASTGNEVADLVLKYRRCRRDLKREERRMEDRANGNHVASMGDIHSKRRGGGGPPGGAARFGPTRHPGPKDYDFDSDSLDSDPLLLVDASAYIFRAYYSMPPLHRYDGMPVGAVLGFCNMLNRLVLNHMLSGRRPRLALVFDAPGPNFRHALYPQYKANRGPCPADLAPQFDLIREVADAYGIAQVEVGGYEADDVIATLAQRAMEEGVDVNVLSGDKDLMQLVTPPHAVPSIHMIDPMNMVRITHDVVVDKWGVPPDRLGDVLALAGDSSDNVPGVPGIGPKIAATLINEYGSLEVLLEEAGSIKQKGRREKVVGNADKARLSRALVELDRSVPLENTTLAETFARIGDIRMDPPSAEKLLDFYDRMGFVDMKRRVSARLRPAAGGGGPAAASAAAGSRPPEAMPAADGGGADGISEGGRGGSMAAEAGRREDVQAGPTAGGDGNLMDDERGGNGPLLGRRKWASPPTPEEYEGVPF